MEDLKYSPSKLIRIHGQIVIQELAQVLSLLNPVQHNHVLNRLSEILSRIIRALLHCHHHNEFRFFVSWPSTHLPSPSNHLGKPFLNHEVCYAGNSLHFIRVVRAFDFFRGRGGGHTEPTSVAECRTSVLKLLLLLVSASLHISHTFEVQCQLSKKLSFM